MNIALIGPRGVGKSKVSRKLSKQTGMPVVSTDMIAVYELGGISIPEYVKTCNGDWSKFRDLEFKILENLKTSRSIILDCGGGIIFDLDENGNEIVSKRKTELLSSFTTIVGLSQDTNYLIDKIKNDASRPSLSQIESYEAILKRRLPIYENTSNHFVKIDGLEPDKVAKWIKNNIL
ncbi:MAG: shikimate kinase [Leptospiraceae bacterium]|nr:shikimate kinase [Leptospiraceae bacterium]